jgi:AbrB family looped-hinge helix DNA binding protein
MGSKCASCKTQIVSTSILSTKGQIVIPARLRKALNLKAGDKVEIKLEGERLIVQRLKRHAARLKPGKFGRLVLVAAKDAPAMTTDSVLALLREFR